MEKTQKKTVKKLLAEATERRELLSEELERKTKERDKARFSVESLLGIRDAKGTEEAIASEKKGENNFIALSSCVQNLELEIDLEIDNENYYKQEMAKEVLIELSKKYQGKKAGEKTLEKLYDEFHEKAGFYGNFKRSCYSQKSEFFQLPNCQGREICLTSAMGKSFIDENNLIQPLNKSCFYVSEKQPTRNTQKRFDKLKEAEKRLEKERMKYNAAVNLYNSLIPIFYTRKNNIY